MSVEWDRLAPKWKNHISLGFSKRDVCACISDGMSSFISALSPSDRVLNIGSGANSSDFMPQLPSSQLFCLDLSHEMLRLGERAHAVQADILAGIPLQDASISLCVSFFLLRYLPKSAHTKILTEISRVLRPQGRFVLVDVEQNDHPGQLSKINAFDLGALARSVGLGRVSSHLVKRYFTEEFRTGYGGVSRTTHPYDLQVVNGQKPPLTHPISNGFLSTRTTS